MSTGTGHEFLTTLCLPTLPTERGDVPWERGKAEWLLSPPFLLSLWPPPVSRMEGWSQWKNTPSETAGWGHAPLLQAQHSACV